MIGGALRPAAAVAAAALLAIGVSTCGDGDDTTTAGGGPTTGATGVQGDRAQAKAQGGSEEAKKGGGGGSGQAEDGGSGASGSDVDAVPLRVSGGGSGQFRTRGGDNSIQDFGEESDESELQAAAEAVHGFYVARAEEDWARACSYLARSMVRQLEQLAGQSPQLSGKGCAPVLRAFTRPLPASVRRETTVVDAGSLRREGERAFLIYRDAEKTVYAMPLEDEDGVWKLTLLSATPLG